MATMDYFVYGNGFFGPNCVDKEVFQYRLEPKLTIWCISAFTASSLGSGKCPMMSLGHHADHYNDVTMSAMASQITCVLMICSAVCSSADKKISKRPFNGLCAGNSPVTGEFPAQRASNAENVSIWWRHHVLLLGCLVGCWIIIWVESLPFIREGASISFLISRWLFLINMN